MSGEWGFFLGVGLAMTLTIGILIYLRTSLLKILEELCGTPDRARFWSAYCQVMLVLTPIIVGYVGRAFSSHQDPLIIQVVHHFVFGLIGLVMGLTVIGFVLASYLANLDPMGGSHTLSRLQDRVDQMRSKDPAA